MQRRYTTLLTSALAVSLAVAAPAAAGKNGTGGNDPQDDKAAKSEVLYDSTTAGDDCGTGNTVTITGDPVLWPPNHKYSSYTVKAVDAEGAAVTLGTSGTHDEYVDGAMTAAPTTQDEADNSEEPAEENGAGNTTEDSRPLVTFDTEDGTNTAVHELRSERSGRGNGRTYTLNFYAEFSDGSCSSSATVEVPHDQRSDNAPEAKDRIGNG